MSLETIAGTDTDFGTTGASAAGIEEVTQAGVEVEFKTVVPAKNGQGSIKAFLVGKKQANLTAAGYVSSFEPPAPGGAITVGGISGKIVASHLGAQAEDFAKANVTGKGVEP
jgi:hypothetical protein